MTQTHTSFSLFSPFYYTTRIDSMRLSHYTTPQCIWLILIDSFPVWLTSIDSWYDSWWLVLTHTDSFWLIFPDCIWLILVQVLVVMADLSVYKNPQKPSYSSLPLSLSFTREYNVSCLVYCLLCESPLFSSLPWSTLALKTTLESCKLYYNNFHTQNHLDCSCWAY